MTSQPGKQTIEIHILPNISRVIEYNMENTFVEKLYTKCGGKTIPRPFSKN